MKPSKLNIVLHLLRRMYARKFSSNKVSPSIKKQWQKALEASTFYHPLLSSDSELPIVNKTLFMERFDDINTVNIKKEDAFRVALKSETSRDFSPTIGEISIGLSSGTSGNKGIFLTSKREKEIWVGAVLDRVIGFSLRKRNIAFFLRANNNLYEAVNSSLLNFQFFDIKTPIAEHFDTLVQLKPDILVAQPSVLMVIARLYQSANTTPQIGKIISVAEVLEDDQKQFFEQVFQCNIEQVYQCTEGFLAHTCKKGNLHFNEDWLEIEKKYIDKEKTRFHPIITDYLRTTQPVVRYELNDIIQEGDACTCGLKSTVIRKIEGRADDVFTFKRNGTEKVIYPDFIRRAVINANDVVVNYRVEKQSDDKIGLFIDTVEANQKEVAFQAVQKSLIQMLLDFGVTEVEVLAMDYQQDPMKKFKRIHNGDV